MAARQFDCGVKRRSFAQQTRVTKIVFDKYFHGENRSKGCTDPSLREELLACTLCGDYDSEEHGICHCQGPPGDNLLQPIRSALFQEITAKIDSIPFGPVYEILALYRDLATDAPHPSGCRKASSPLCSGPSFWFPYLLCPLRSTSFCLPLSGMFKPCSAPPSPGSERSSPHMPSLICVVAPLLPLLQRRHEILVRCVDSPVSLMSSVERTLDSVTVA